THQPGRGGVLVRAPRAHAQVLLEPQPLGLRRVAPEGGDRDPRGLLACQRHDSDPVRVWMNARSSGRLRAAASSSRRANQMRDLVAARVAPVSAATSSIEYSSMV